MLFKELDPIEFDEFVNKHIPYTPYQSSAYGSTMEGEDYKVYYVGIKDNDIVVAASMIMVGNIKSFKYAYAPRGFLIDYKNRSLLEFFTINIKKFLGSKGVVALKINPMVVKNIYNSKYELIASNPDFDEIYNDLTSLGYRHMGFNNFFEALKPRFDAIIDINDDYFKLFTNMRKEVRTKVRGAENSGVKIYKGDDEEIQKLYEQAKGKYPRPLKYYDDLYKNFSKNDEIELYYAKVDFDIYLKRRQSEFVNDEEAFNMLNEEVLKSGDKANQKLISKKMVIDKNLNASKAKLTSAISLTANHPEGMIIAAVFVVKANKTATIMIDSFDKNFSTFNGKHLIIWKLIEKFSKEGYHLFNLGGIANKVDVGNKYYGLNNYKLGFGAKAYEYIGDLELVTNKPLYLMYNNSVNLFKKKK